MTNNTSPKRTMKKYRIMLRYKDTIIEEAIVTRSHKDTATHFLNAVKRAMERDGMKCPFYYKVVEIK